MTFEVGASMAQICKFCRHVVVRTDRDFRNMGRVADLTNTPCPIAVDDQGTLDGRAMRVAGRVQLDHGAGPWDEWYVAFQDGTWGWLAYAQGNWYSTQEVQLPHALPGWRQLSPEMDLPLGSYGFFRVAEVKRGTMVSGEGELPFVVEPGAERYYADLQGPNGAFATIDYGTGAGHPKLFVGWQRPESALQVRPMGERAHAAVATDAIVCPNCGGNIPALTPGRAERLACPYCNAVSDIGSRKVLEQQTAARARPDIPLGTKGTLFNGSWIVCGYVERSASIEDEWFSWQEYLLFQEGLGFRWLVKDEGSWLFIEPVNIAEIDLTGLPRSATYRGTTFSRRNQNEAQVDYVLGEFYWKVAIGETVDAMDFISGGTVLSRERAGDEVAWSLGTPVAWSTLAQGFGLPEDGAGSVLAAPSSSTSTGGSNVFLTLGAIVGIIILIAICNACGCTGSGGGFSGGGWSGGSRGGK